MKVLFLGMYMSGLHGSVLHLLEYAKFFKSINAEVSIGAVFIDSEIKKRTAEEGINLYRINNVPVNEEYDLVYALHLFLFPYLLFKGINYKHAILALLSVKGPLEQLPPSCMYPYFDLITVISPEIAARYLDEFQIDENLFTLIPNPLPLDFINESGTKTEWANKIGAVAVVSNHRVPELLDMAKLAPWHTDFFGSEYGQSMSITPELLFNYDAIITIGKTVQYGLGIGIPVYEYDYNGGCGWINTGNLETEAMTNFSGRSTYSKKDAEALLADMEAGYKNTVSQASALREITLEKFSIIRLITKQLKHVFTRPPKGKPALSPDAWFYANTCYLAVDHILGLMKIRAGHNNTLQDASKSN